jgi:hypothetical protein
MKLQILGASTRSVFHSLLHHMLISTSQERVALRQWGFQSNETRSLVACREPTPRGGEKTNRNLVNWCPCAHGAVERPNEHLDDL